MKVDKDCEANSHSSTMSRCVTAARGGREQGGLPQGRPTIGLAADVGGTANEG